MANTFRLLGRMLGEYLLLGLCLLAIPLILAYDRNQFYFGSSEHSLTETLQLALLLLSSLAVWRMRNTHPGSSAWIPLVSGFFLVMLIRELDYYIDMIRHGAWVYVALAVAIAAVALAVRAPGNIVDGLAWFSRTQAHAYVMAGLLIVLVFSRLIGSRAFLVHMMGEDYDPYFKTAMQEGLELMGYLLVAWGVGRSSLAQS